MDHPEGMGCDTTQSNKYCLAPVSGFGHRGDFYCLDIQLNLHSSRYLSIFEE